MLNTELTSPTTEQKPATELRSHQLWNRLNQMVDRWIEQHTPAYSSDRRKIVIGLALLGVSALLPELSTPVTTEEDKSSDETKEKKELLQPGDLITYIDIDPDYDNQTFFRQLTGLEVALPSYPEDTNERKQALSADLLNPETAPIALAQSLLDSFRSTGGALVQLDRESNGLIDHAALVTGTSQEVLRSLNWPTGETTVLPLQAMISETHFSYSDEGLPQLEIRVDQQLLIEALRGVEDPIINMSFQVGQWSVTIDQLPRLIPENYYTVSSGTEFQPAFYAVEPFDDVEFPMIMLDENDQPIGEVPKPRPYRVTDDGSREYLEIYTREELSDLDFETRDRYLAPSTQILEAYRPETAQDNFTRLIELANAYPDKLFVAAAGNYNSMSREQRQQLQDIWPENLLLTGLGLVRVSAAGFEDDRLLTNNIADIYLPADFGQRLISSSESAGVISALAAIIKIRNPDFSPAEIRQYLIDHCTDAIPETEDGPLLPTLNFERCREILEEV